MADLLFTQIPGMSIPSGTTLLHTSGRSALGVAPGAYIADATAVALRSTHPRFVARAANGRYFRALPQDGAVPVELGGATGDGVSDDRAAIKATFDYAAAAGIASVSLHGRRYAVGPTPLAETDYQAGPQPNLVLPQGTRVLDGRGAALTFLRGGRGLAFGRYYNGSVAEAQVVSNVAAGGVELTLAPGQGEAFASGDDVVWSLGALPYDAPEPLAWDIARIVARNADVVRLDKPIPEAVSGEPGGGLRLRKLPLLRDCCIRDLTIVGGAGTEDGVEVYGGQRIALERVGGRDLGAGLFVGQYVDGVTLADCWADATVSATQPAHGAMVSLAEARNVLLLRPRARGLRLGVKCEAGAEASVVGFHFENTATDAGGAALGTGVTVLHATGRSVIAARDLTVTGHGGYLLAETSNGNPAFEGHVTLSGTTRQVHPTSPYNVPIGRMSGTLDMTIAGAREVYNLDRLRSWRRRFVLRNGEYLTVLGPPGLLVRAQAYCSPGVTVGAGQQLEGFYIGREGNNGSNLAAGQLQPGADVAIRVFGGSVAGTQWNDRHRRFQVLCVTRAGSDLDTANSFVEFEGWFAEQERTATAVGEGEWRGRDADRESFEARFPAVDLPPIAAGECAILELPVPAMQPDQFIEAVRFEGGTGMLSLSAAEAGSGSLRLVLENRTQATIDKGPAEIAVAYASPIMGR